MKKLLGILTAVLIFLSGCVNSEKIINNVKVPVFNVKYTTIVDVEPYKELFDKVEKQEIKHIVLQIHSPGAEFYQIMYILNRMNDLKDKGVIIETRTYGLAGSGAFAMFVNGTKGYRKTHADSMFMIHTIQKRTGYNYVPIDESTPKNRFLLKMWFRAIAKGTGLTEKQVRDWLKTGDEYWYTGTDMLKKGWADKEL